MSVIDLIVGLLMLWAVFNGWRQGLILQLCSLAGIVLGGWLGIRPGAPGGGQLPLGGEVGGAAGGPCAPSGAAAPGGRPGRRIAPNPQNRRTRPSTPTRT